MNFLNFKSVIKTRIVTVFLYVTREHGEVWILRILHEVANLPIEIFAFL